MITQEQAAKLIELIEQYTNAEVEHSWAGSQPPNDMEQLEKEAYAARQALKAFLSELQQPVPEIVDEPCYVLRYVDVLDGPLGNTHALVFKRDWEAGLSRAVAEPVLDHEGKPLIAYMRPKGAES